MVEIASIDTSHHIDEVVVETGAEATAPIEHCTLWVANVHLFVLVEFEYSELIAIVSEEVAHCAVCVVQASQHHDTVHVQKHIPAEG